MLCIGPPLPSRNLNAQGTKHCQRYLPGFPVLKVKVVVVWSKESAQGPTLHGFFAVAEVPLSATETPRSGIVHVCEASIGSRMLTVFPSTLIVPPPVPRGWPQ